jgi:hypothetical protein
MALWAMQNTDMRFDRQKMSMTPAVYIVVRLT